MLSVQSRVAHIPHPIRLRHRIRLIYRKGRRRRGKSGVMGGGRDGTRVGGAALTHNGTVAVAMVVVVGVAVRWQPILAVCEIKQNWCKILYASLVSDKICLF